MSRPSGRQPKTKKPQCGNTEVSGNEINFEEEIVMSNATANSQENNAGMSYATLIPVHHGQIGGKNMYVCNARDVYICVGAARRFTTWIAGRIEEYGFAEGHDFAVQKVSPRSGRNSSGGRPSLEYVISSNMAKELAMVERTEKGRAIRNYFIACEEAFHQVAPVQAAELLRKALSPEQQHQLSAKVHGKVACLAKARQRAGYAELWSGLKARHQVAQYRDIPQAEFGEACQYVDAFVWGGEFLGREEQKPQGLSIHFPVEELAKRRPGMLVEKNGEKIWADITLHDLRDLRDMPTPCESIIYELDKAGYKIDGAWLELRTYRNKLRELASFITGLNRVIEDPQRYAINVETAA